MKSSDLDIDYSPHRISSTSMASHPGLTVGSVAFAPAVTAIATGTVSPSTLHERFVQAFDSLSVEIHQNAVNKGFWNAERNDGEALMLMVTELAEAMEGLRKNNPPDDKLPAFSSAEVELADCVIRVMDLAKARGWRVAEAMIAKMTYNTTRPYMHGKTC